MDKISGTAIWVQAEACGLGSMLRAGSSIAYHLFRLRYFVLIKVIPSGEPYLPAYPSWDWLVNQHGNATLRPVFFVIFQI